MVRLPPDPGPAREAAAHLAAWGVPIGYLRTYFVPAAPVLICHRCGALVFDATEGVGLHDTWHARLEQTLP